MDLVPILTTIILVGTLATLMLIIFTYSLYKVRARRTIPERQEPKYVVSRRRKRRKLLDADETPHASLGQPAEASMYVPPTSAPLPHEPDAEGEGETQASSAADESSPPKELGNTASGFATGNDATLFLEYTGEGFVPVDPSASARPGAHSRSHADKENDGHAWL